MRKEFTTAVCAAWLSLGLASPGIAAEPSPLFEATDAAERLLGSDGEDAQMRSYLPFTRTIGASSEVVGTLEVSTERAGVPPAAMLEVFRAFATAIDLNRDLRNGDRFYIRYERSFTAAGNAIGIGRVLWAELRTAAKGTVAAHRFRTHDGTTQFWLTSGQAAAPPFIRLPVDVMRVSSGFGLRADPLDQPVGQRVAMGPLSDPVAAERPAEIAAPAAPAISPVTGGSRAPRDFFDTSRELDPARLKRLLAAREAQARAAEPPPVDNPSEKAPEQAKVAPPAAPRLMFMHEGLDLVASIGTPVYAASDGVVVGAGPNGGYGNWIRLDHSGRLTTVYGHLSRLAPGIDIGVPVMRGELIGFVGNTGRSTGAHLHFELLSDGRPVNPLNHPRLQRDQLRGADLERFRKQVTAAMREREYEAMPLLAAN